MKPIKPIWVIVIIVGLIMLTNQGKKEGGSTGATQSECNSLNQAKMDSGHLCVTDCFQMTSTIISCLNSNGYDGYDSSDVGKWKFYWDQDEDCSTYYNRRINTEHVVSDTALAACVPSVGDWLSGKVPLDIISFSTNKDGQTVYPGDSITATFTVSNYIRSDKSDFIAEFSMYPKYKNWYPENGQKWKKLGSSAFIGCCQNDVFTDAIFIDVPFGQTETFTITTKIPDKLDIFNCGASAYQTAWDLENKFVPVVHVFETCEGSGYPVATQDWDSNSYFTVTCRNEIAGNGIDDDCDGTRDEGGSCTPNWNCASWSTCSASCTQTRTCTDLNSCGTNIGKPSESQTCSGGACTQPSTKSFEITSFSIDKTAVKENEQVTATFTIKNNEASCPLGIDSSSVDNKCNYAVEFGLYPKRLADSWGYQPNSKKSAQFAVTKCVPDVWTSATGVKLNAGDSETITLTATTSSRNMFTQNAPVLYAFDTQIVPIITVYKSCGDSSTYSDWKTLNVLPLTCDNPGTEIANGVDDDCDGSIDEGLGGGEASQCMAFIQTCKPEGSCVTSDNNCKINSIFMIIGGIIGLMLVVKMFSGAKK